MNGEIDQKCINEIRMLSAELPLKANSGHQGAPIGCAPIAHILWAYVMNYYNEDTKWMNRDRFVLSNGHASALLYTMLYLTKQGLTMEDLKNFRQLESLTPGHPEKHITKGVEVTTGPLGQGASNAVGMAICAHNLAEKYNTKEFPIFDNYIYAMCGRLILLYDDNKITIDGNTELSFTENIEKKFEALKWEVRKVANGNTDFEGILTQIEEAKKNTKQPSLIIVQTACGYGTKVEGTCKSHGLALKEEDLKKAKLFFGLDPEKQFHISEEVKKFYENIVQKKKENYLKWKKMFCDFTVQYPEKAQEIMRRFSKELPHNWVEVLPKYTTLDAPGATRNLSGVALNCINKVLPELIGGSADLTESNCTALKEEKDICRDSFANKYIRYGVREHGMVAITNGIYAYGGFEPFCATFLNFYTYAFGALRLAALSQYHIFCIATHDSVELGEDGPTHQPVEVLALLRATPNLNVIRPADGNEVSGAYLCHFTNPKTPTLVALCRNKVPHLKNTSAEQVLKGAYVLEDFDNANDKQKVILAGCGSELHLCFDAKKILTEQHNLNVRIVSFPSWNLFRQQSEDYQQSVMMHHDAKVVRFYIEPASTYGFDTYFNVYLGINQFGYSAPKNKIWEHLGFTSENIVCKVLAYIKAKMHP
ncbi:transketolase [Plasmodium cynomolgi strain B]|uniref:transketolase n=1 Tax=Plasmodium cynomolgi (strain B) TaxID=1120755 RepID=K6UDZ1_PLACD|nr:transketolase [Plasmodium cynomolgi strain B]GAB67441.1 transketolase [Plasmodium cynomolgi strain B]